MTPQLLQKALRCTPALAERFAAPLMDACRVYQINTAARLAAFLAQIGHESKGLSTLSESLNYSVDGLLSTFGRHRISDADARRLGRMPGRPADQVAIANCVYGGDWGREALGNTQPNDGWDYRARGGAGITGRANYRLLTTRLRARGVECPDFEAEPDALCEPWWAALSAADYWDMRGCNALADAGDFIALTKRINGGTNGLADRQARLQWAQDALEGIDVAPLLIPLAGALIDAFAPLATEKIKKVMGTDNPAVAEQVASAIVDTAKALTGQVDPIQAVAAVQADPAKLEQVQGAALAKLSELAPLIDKLAEIDARDRQADEASRDAAARRAAAEPWDMTRTLVYGAFGMLALLILLVATVALIQLRGGAIASEVWAQVAGLIGFATGVGVTIYAYRFGTSKSSAAKDVVISTMADRR